MDIINKSENNMNILNNIKSKYILKEIFNNLLQNTLLRFIKYNNSLQNRLELDLNDYKLYTQIEIEIIPKRIDNKNKYINFSNEKRAYYHIYFNDNKNEINRNYFTKFDNVKKIKIKIDACIKSFAKLFKNCKCIEKISFLNLIEKILTI